MCVGEDAHFADVVACVGGEDARGEEVCLFECCCGIEGGVSVECITEGRGGKEEEHTKSNEKLVIVTIVQTVNEVA